MAKRVNKNMVAVLTTFGFVIMTVAGVLMILKLRQVDPEEYVAKAEAYAAAENWPEAHVFYQKAYSVSEDEKYLVDAGQMLLNAGDEARAIGAWQAALTHDPQLLPAQRKLLDYFYELARTFPSIGVWRRVLELADALLEMDDQDPFGLMCRGRALLVLQEEDPTNLDEGFRALRRAVEIAPDNVDYSLALALAEAQHDRAEVSEELFERLIKANATAGTDAYRIRGYYGQFLSSRAARAQTDGRLAEWKQLRERALAAFQEGIALAGDDPVDQAGARVNLVRDLLARELGTLIDQPEEKARADELTEQVKTLLREAIKLDPDGFDQYMLLVDLHRALGDREKAIEVCEQRMKGKIDRKGFKGRQQKWGLFDLLNRAALESVGLAAEKPAGSEEREALLVKAEQFVRDAKGELPTNPEAIHTEGRILLVRGKDLEALAKFEEADRAFGGPHWQNKLHLANLYLMQNEVGAAREAIEAAIKQPQANPAVWLTYARVLLAANQPRQAAIAAQEILKKDPGNRQARLVQADAFRLLGRPELMHEAVELLEDDPDKQLVRARAFESEKKYQEALDILEPILEADPGRQAVVTQVARIYRRMKRLDEAKAVVRRGLEANPEDLNLKKLAIGLEEDLTTEQRDERVLKALNGAQDEYVRAWELAKFYMFKDNWDEAVRQLAEAERLLRDGATPAAVEAMNRQGPAALRQVVDRRFLVVCTQERWDAAEEIAAQAAAEDLDGAAGLTYYGRLHLFQDRPEQAVTAFQQALEKHESSATLALLGQAYVDLKRFDEARATFERAVSINPNSGPAHKGLAVLAYDSKDVAVFARHYAECERLLPDDPWVQQVRGELDRLERPEEAIAKLAAKLEEDPNDVKTLLELAPLYAKTQQMEKAGECYEKSLELAPDSLAVARQAVNYYLAMGRPDRGREILEKVQTTVPEPPRKAAALLMLADLLAQQNELEQADATYLAAADQHEGVEICRSIGRHFFATGRPAMAVPWFEKVVAKAKEDNDPRIQQFESTLVEALLKKGDFERATEGVRHLLATYPLAGNPALLFRAEIEVGRGQVDEAVKSLSQYLEGQPGNPLAMFRRAQYRALQGKWGLAIEDLELLKAREPDALSFEPRKWLARAYDRAGRADQAVAEFEALLEENPDDTRFANLLVSTHLQHKGFVEADRVAQRMLNRQVDASYWLFRRGQIKAEWAADQPQGSEDRERYTRQALEDLSQAAQAGGYGPHIVVPLLDICSRLEAYDYGIELYENKLPSEQRVPAVIAGYAGLLARQGLNAKAIEHYRLAAEAGLPQGALFLRAIVVDAVDALGEQRAVELFRVPPEDERLARVSQLLLATALPLSGQYSEAATIFEQLLTTAKDDAERGTIYLLYGTASDYGKDYEQAKQSYENVVRLEPTNWVAHNNLAYMLCEQLGQCAEARAYAERAMALVPESHVVADTLATVLIGLGEERRAIGILMQALEREPAFVTGHIHLADAYRRLGEFTLAQAKLEEARQLIEAGPAGQPSDQSEKITAMLDRVRSRDSSP